MLHRILVEEFTVRELNAIFIGDFYNSFVNLQLIQYKCLFLKARIWEENTLKNR